MVATTIHSHAHQRRGYGRGASSRHNRLLAHAMEIHGTAAETMGMMMVAQMAQIGTGIGTR